MPRETATEVRVDDSIVRNDLPASCKLVYLYLRVNGSATQKELKNGTGLSGRGVRYALEGLQKRDVIEAEPSPEDGRQTVYKPRE